MREGSATCRAGARRSKDLMGCAGVPVATSPKHRLAIGLRSPPLRMSACLLLYWSPSHISISWVSLASKSADS